MGTEIATVPQKVHFLPSHFKSLVHQSGFLNCVQENTFYTYRLSYLVKPYGKRGQEGPLDTQLITSNANLSEKMPFSAWE